MEHEKQIKKREVGFLLGMGIFFMPIIFVWLLLRKGHSTTSRVVGFGFLGIIVLCILNSAFPKIASEIGSLAGILVFFLIPFCMFHLAKRKMRNPWPWTIMSFFLPFLPFLILAMIIMPPGTYGMQDLSEYLKENPDCRTESGIKCNKCGAKSIRSWGSNAPNSRTKVHICNHCGTNLYTTTN